MGASSTPPVEPIGTGWHVKGETLRRDGDVLTVTVTWQKLWEDSRWLRNSREDSKTLTLRMGERLVLDPVTPAAYTCGDARLEAGIVTRPVWQLKRGGTSSGTGSVLMRSSDLLRKGSAPELPAAAVLPPGPVADLELWLVDTWADGSEHAVRQRVRTGISADAGSFRFTSAVTSTTGDKSVVSITGDVRSVAGPTPRILLHVDRRVVVEGTRPRGSSGTSTVNLAMPDPTDVIGIELPGGREAAPLVPGHRYSLRLRLTPDR